MKSPLPSVLVVDDEKHALELLSRSLRKHAKVTTATSGDEAWQLVCSHDFLIVISDQLMPGMTGVDLLSRIAASGAEVGRILLTGYSDLDATIAAINRGHVHAYLHKPCSPPDLLTAIKTVSDRVELLRENARLRESVVASRRAAGSRFDPHLRTAARLAAPLAALQHCGGAQSAVDSLGELARDLLDPESDLAAPAAARIDSIDEVVETALRELAETTGALGVHLESELAAGPTPGVEFGAIRLALDELIASALAAMPDGGCLRITTCRDGDHVVLGVSDATGALAAAAQLLALECDAAESRASLASRNGLGLAILRRVAQLHAGSVELDKGDVPGAGVALRLRVEPIGSESNG